MKVVFARVLPENFFPDVAFKSDGAVAIRNEAGCMGEMRNLAAALDALPTDDPALAAARRISCRQEAKKMQ